MTAPLTLALFGFGIKLLLVANNGPNPREAPRDATLRQRAIEAQRIAANAARIAQDLAARVAKD